MLSVVCASTGGDFSSERVSEAFVCLCLYCFHSIQAETAAISIPRKLVEMESLRVVYESELQLPPLGVLADVEVLVAAVVGLTEIKLSMMNILTFSFDCQSCRVLVLTSLPIHIQFKSI